MNGGGHAAPNEWTRSFAPRDFYLAQNGVRDHEMAREGTLRHVGSRYTAK